MNELGLINLINSNIEDKQMLTIFDNFTEEPEQKRTYGRNLQKDTPKTVT